MLVLDRKPIGRDNDDEHHCRLIDRQHNNNNDASQIFASRPKGPTVVVQQEHGGLWTHGTIVGKGDRNYHKCSYTIQLTTTGRRITCNRQYIKPTLVTADAYIHYQAIKNTNRQTDPLDAILEHIKDNPQAYANRPIHSNSNNIQNTHVEQQQKISHKEGGQIPCKRQ